MIIYTSDHGYFMGEHGWYDKRFMYEPSIRIPLVACFPGAAPGGIVSSEMAMNIDFARQSWTLPACPFPTSCRGAACAR